MRIKYSIDPSYFVDSGMAVISGEINVNLAGSNTNSITI